MSTDRPRSLADDLRARDDASLAALLRARPDLLNPVPSDVAALAARATSRPSVQRALDQLDLFTMQVVEVLCALSDPVAPQQVGDLLGADPTAALTALRERALVYGDDTGILVARTVREVVGSPAGLGPPAEQALAGYGPGRLERLSADLGLPVAGDPYVAAGQVAEVLADPVRLAQLLADVSPEAREALTGLTWGAPTGRVERARRDVDIATAHTPVDELLARGLLVAAATDSVVLPREVGMHLRDGRVHAEPEPKPPSLDLTHRDATQVDRTAAGAAFTVVRLVEDLLELWANEPPKALRAGGIGVRERNRAMAALDLDDAGLALVAEVAAAAGLLAVGGELDEAWLPTTAYDGWLGQDVAERWADLVEAWLASTRVPGLAGTDDRGRTMSLLGPELDRSVAPQLRRAALDELAAAPPAAAASTESILARLRWQAPRRGGRLRDDLVTAALHEAETLGLVGRGALGRPGRELLGGDTDAAVRSLTALLPEPLDHVLLQADLTAVAPGPLRSDLAARLRMAADVESTGGATVYRFSDSSVRRALDAGWSVTDLLGLLEAHSRTPVPQPLSYLVEDVGRRHGRIRVGAASSYLRCDDEALLGEIAADRRLAALRLRRLAPMVLAAQAAPEVVLERLRAAGYAPAAETAEGDVLVHRADAQRAPVRRPAARLVTTTPSASPALLDAAVRAVRAGDRALTAIKRRDVRDPAAGSVRVPRKGTADILALLAEGVQAGAALWMGYVNAEGHATQRVVEPISVEGGYVKAYDHLRDEVRTFAIHRITGVSHIDETAS
jgi:hypothetical protein